MNELALFAGAGGGILGGKLLGWRTICAVELDPYCRRVLMQRQDDGLLNIFPIWDDVCTFDGTKWAGRVDVVSGGFPCQGVSIANDEANGLSDARSGLWVEMARIVGEVRPRFVLVENSSALTFRGLGSVLRDLAKLGYDARWGVIGACAAGACHQRHRIWILAHYPYEIRCLRPSIQGVEPLQANASRRQFERAINAAPSSLGDSDRLRDSYDVARWMERYSAIGNGQIPAVVRLAWETLRP